MTPRVRWRRVARAVHRDIGFLVAALTLAYAISGLAVNHIEDWNPNYTFHEREVDVGPLPDVDDGNLESLVVQTLAIDEDLVRGHFLESAAVFRVFLDNGQEVRLDPKSGRGVFKEVKTRPGLYEVNALHLNSIKGWWTWVADGFAVLLIVLVLTGVTMMKGKRGLSGRGKWILAVGFVIPAGFVWYLVA